MATKTTQLALTKIEFEQTGSSEDPGSRLLATVNISGAYHHLEAIAVDTNGNGEQCAADLSFETMLGALHEAFGPDGTFQTAHIDGREYAIFMSPFGN